MIYKTLADILHLDDQRFNEAHIDAIKQSIEFDGNAQITVTLSLKRKELLLGEVAGKGVTFSSFLVERKVKVSRPIHDGKEQVNLGFVSKKVYLDLDGEIVTRDELPITEDE